MATAKKKKGATTTKKAAAKTTKAPKAKKGRVTLPPELAKKARGMLSQIRDWYNDAKDNKNGKAGKQRKLAF